jgi:hypothetical protein
MKIDTSIAIGLAGLFIGYVIAKRKAGDVTRQTSNEVTTAGEWWTYAGSWGF